MICDLRHEVNLTGWMILSSSTQNNCNNGEVGVARQVILGESVSPYHQPKIAIEHWPQIRTDYPTKTLKQLATEWNVCQQTIRKIIRS